jgi:putative SOS response-associated peptidase YedK
MRRLRSHLFIANIMCGRGRYSLQAKTRTVQLSGRNVRNHNLNVQVNTSTAADLLINGDGNGTINMIDNDNIENLSPGMLCPVLVQNNNLVEITMMTWGLIPAYTAVSHKPNHFTLFNKRIESLTKSGYYKKLVETNRCVVILDGFFEWKTVIGSKHKQPYYCCFRHKPLQIAGIFEFSKKLDGNDDVTNFATFSILTGEPSSKFSALHNREPVLLTDEQAMRWLDLSQNVDTLLTELVANPTDPQLDLNSDLQFYPVTPKMSSAQYQGSDCALPLDINQTSEDLRGFLRPVCGANSPIDRKCDDSDKVEDSLSADKHVTKKPKLDTSQKSTKSGPTVAKKSTTQCNSIQSYFQKS